MNFLVTGGAGFIGSHLCEVLLSQNHQVICVDNFNDFYDPEIKKNNLISCLKNELFTLYSTDIRDFEALQAVFQENQIDFVIHLAAMAGVRPSIENPKLYEEVNIGGTSNILEIIKKQKIQKFIFASSSSVYGNNPKVPFSEEDKVDFSISPYAATKKAGEVLCHVYHHLYNIDMALLRFFTVYGPRQRPDLAIHKFTHLIQNDLEVPFFGDGTTKRDYTYIDDIIHGVLQAIEYVNQNPKTYEIFNLGENQTISLKEMIEVIQLVLQKKARLNMLPLQPGDVTITYANIDKAKKYLQYNPTTSFDKGIATFIDWYQSIKH